MDEPSLHSPGVEPKTCRLYLLVIAALRRRSRLFGQVGVVNALVIQIVKGDVRVEMMRLGLLFVFSLQLRQLLRILLSQIDAFSRIVVQVVEFPRAFVKGRISDYVLGEDVVGIR